MIRPRVVLIPAACSAVVAASVLFAGWLEFSSPMRPPPEIETARQELQVITQAAEQWKLKLKAYPPSIYDLARLVRASQLNDFEDYWPEGAIIDPWDRPYLYRVANGELRVGTLGADGKEGGSGEDRDLGDFGDPAQGSSRLRPLGQYLASRIFERACFPALLSGAVANVLCFGALRRYLRRPEALGWGPALVAAAIAILSSLFAGWILLQEAFSGH